MQYVCVCCKFCSCKCSMTLMNMQQELQARCVIYIVLVSYPGHSQFLNFMHVTLKNWEWPTDKASYIFVLTRFLESRHMWYLSMGHPCPQLPSDSPCRQSSGSVSQWYPRLGLEGGEKWLGAGMMDTTFSRRGSHHLTWTSPLLIAHDILTGCLQ